MNRRRFLQLVMASAAMVPSWRLWAASTASVDTRFVLIFLRGAYDALSALVPYGDSFYYESRPTIALMRPDLNNMDAAIGLDGRWAMHPAMDDSLLSLWEAKQLAFVPFAGTGFVSRSHFQAQDWVEYGQAPVPNPDSGSGFLNRLLLELGANDHQSSGVSFTQTLSPIMRGIAQTANSPLSLSRRSKVNMSYEDHLMGMYIGHPLESMVQDGLGLRREISRELRKEMQESSRRALPAGGFALQAERMGRLLRDHPNYKVAFADIGGWDTHAAQGGARGVLANRLRGLSDGLKAMTEAMGSEWEKTVVVVMSEFGRTFRENGSKGTDHGHGSTMWVLGGGVRGGVIGGEQGDILPGKLHQDRDLPVLNEYRNVLAGLFVRQFGLSREALARIFPGCSIMDLGLL